MTKIERCVPRMAPWYSVIKYETGAIAEHRKRSWDLLRKRQRDANNKNGAGRSLNAHALYSSALNLSRFVGRQNTEASLIVAKGVVRKPDVCVVRLVASATLVYVNFLASRIIHVSNFF